MFDLKDNKEGKMEQTKPIILVMSLVVDIISLILSALLCFLVAGNLPEFNNYRNAEEYTKDVLVKINWAMISAFIIALLCVITSVLLNFYSLAILLPKKMFSYFCMLKLMRVAIIGEIEDRQDKPMVNKQNSQNTDITQV